MPTVTATQVLSDFFQGLEIYTPAETPTAADNTTALRQLNLMVGQWAHESLLIPAVSRTIVTLLANKGSSTNPYTIGPGGDINIAKPPNQQSLVGAGLLLNASAPFPVEIPRGLMTNEGWENQRIKDLTSVLFTNVYYRPDFAGGLGSLFLWPVPLDLTNNLILYIRAALSTFADLTTSYSIPDGYDEMLWTNLAVRAARFFGRVADSELKEAAHRSMSLIKRSNTQITDLPNDFGGLGGSRRGLYNIQTGEEP